MAGGAAAVVLEWGVVRSWPAWRERVQRRRSADRLLLGGAESHTGGDFVERRASELVSARNRKTLARSLRSIVREVEGRVLPGPVPLNRHGILSELDSVRELETRLADLSRPVAPRGVLLVERLLTEPGSPIYSKEHGHELHSLLAEARVALEASSQCSSGGDETPSLLQRLRPNHLNFLGGR